MFSFIKNSLNKIYSTITQKIDSFFNRSTIDADTIKELERLLIAADTGSATTKLLIDKVKTAFEQGSLEKGQDLHDLLHKELVALLERQRSTPTTPDVYLLVGINGCGKTTFAAKLAHMLQQQGKTVLLVAADTFRAAAVEQLEQWATATNTPLITGSANQDPASVIFAGCQAYIDTNAGAVIIDTAGRLQTKDNLMRELTKMKKVIEKKLPNATIATLLTVDAMLGQNSLEQARVFKQATNIDDIVLTKMDGTGKGGIIFAIAQELQLPVSYISFGEQLEQMKPFDAQEFVTDLLTFDKQ